MNLPVWQLSEGHIESVDTAEAETAVGVRARQAVDRGGAQSHKQRLVGGMDWRGGRLEAPSDQHGTAAAVMQFEGLGGLHTAYKAPLWRKITV